ncbi:response regulator transcription factor [Brucella intermedia]|uniref:response regulator transcription factor n=2 Tax=Brucella intermedia TaxID=94625 RepID=UPI00330673C8
MPDTMGTPSKCEQEKARQMRILVVEDEREQASMLEQVLTSQNMVADTVATCAEAEHMLAEDCYDAVILDRRLPDGDGLSVLRRLRGRGSATGRAVKQVSCGRYCLRCPAGDFGYGAARIRCWTRRGFR